LIDLKGSIPSFIHISDGKMHNVKVLDLLCEQGHIEAGVLSTTRYPEALRCVTFIDAQTDKRFVFLTNNFALPAITICALYKQRWQVELFFKSIKQQLRIKAFYGNTENAVNKQIWVAIANMKKRLNLTHSLYEILRLLDLNMFETASIETLLGRPVEPTEPGNLPVQQDLSQTSGLVISIVKIIIKLAKLGGL